MKEISVNSAELHDMGMSVLEISMELFEASSGFREIFDTFRRYIPSEYDNAFSAYSMLRQICEQSEYMGKCLLSTAQMYYECEKKISDMADDLYYI